MASQPLNSDIAVFRRVRIQARNERHDSIKSLGVMREKYVVVPAEEVRVLETKDSVVTDTWRYGHPVVRYVREFKNPQTVINNVDKLDMPVRLTVDHREYKLQKTADGAGEDLFGEAADA